MPSPVQLALSACTMTVALGASPALADVALPVPYVSRALDAVLLPIDADVRSAFALGQPPTTASWCWRPSPAASPT